MIRLIHNTNSFIKTPNTMKKHNLFTVGALAAAMLFSACNKDMDVPAGSTGGGQDVVEGIPTYAKVEITQRASSGTYAGAGDYVQGESDASTEEKAIQNAYVLIFSNGYLECLEPLTNDGGTFSATFPITTGRKQCFAIANVNDLPNNPNLPDNPDLDPVTPGDTPDPDNNRDLTAIIAQIEADIAANNQQALSLDAIRQKVCAISDIDDAASDNNFYMGNVYPLGQTDERVDIIEEATEEEVTTDMDPKNNITIYIGRMVSKVTPTFTATTDTQIGGTLTAQKYRVRNNPKRFYLFPVYVQEEGKKEGTKVDVLSSPYYSITDYNWAITSKGYDLVPQKLYSGDFFSNNHSADGQTMDNTRFVDFGTASYLTENSPKTPLRRKATMLSICGKWSPDNDQILNKDGVATNAGLTTGDGTFCRVQIIGAAEDANKGLILGYLPGVYDVAEPGTIAVAWKETIGDEDTPDNKISLTGGNGTGTLDGAAVEYKAVKYAEGICYYGYWMKQTIVGATVAQQYAIKRNNHYNVKITSVDGPGDPTEDDVLNKPEEIEADSYMKAIIEVLNWNVVGMEGGI